MQVDVLAGTGEVHLREQGFFAFEGISVGCEDEGRSHGEGDGLEAEFGFGVAYAYYGGDSGLEDACFFAGDCGSGRSQEGAVVQAYGGDYG